MYADILLPTDGSSATVRALDHALAIAGPNEATVHVLSVIDKRHAQAAPEDTKAEITRALEEQADRAIDDAQIRVEDSGLPCKTAIETGIPHKTIGEYAESEGVDLVVMGTHGKTGPEQIATLGSTTERVVNNGSVPVLVVDLSDSAE